MERDIGSLIERLVSKVDDLDQLNAIYKQLTMQFGIEKLSVTPNIRKVFGMAYNNWGNRGGEEGGKLAEYLLLDAITIKTLGYYDETDESKLYFITVIGQQYAMIFGVKDAEVKSPEEAIDRYLALTGLVKPEDIVGIETSTVQEEPEEEFEEGPEEEFEEEPEEEPEEETEEPEKEPEEEHEDEQKEPTSIVDKDFLNYYSDSINGNIETLMFRYEDLFASGFEMDKFAGIFTDRDLVQVKNGVWTEYFTATTQKIARYVTSSILGTNEVLNINGREIPIVSNKRSIKDIAEDITAVYSTGDLRKLYFPRKMLEISLGRKLTVRTESDSYDPTPEGKSWSSYKKLVKQHMTDILVFSGKLFLTKQQMAGMLPKGDLRTPEGLDVIGPFMSYFVDCLSNCIIGVEFSKLNNVVVALKVRFFDKENKINNQEFIPSLIKSAFGSSAGVSPFNDVEVTGNNVKTFTHERNHKAYQAIPSFAYKAYLITRANGIPLNMDNLILGKSPKGTIMKNGTDGVSLANKATHYVIAGSRAGKGVMTLNFLGGALAAGRPVFYLDNKPDMAAMFSEIAPGMVVVNGKSLLDGDIDFREGLGYWLNIDSRLNKANIPDYALEAFGLPVSDSSRTWRELGDIFYFRAFQLIMGFMLHNVMNTSVFAKDPNTKKYVDKKYGTTGFCLVVDEITNTLVGVMSALEKLACIQAPLSMDKAVNSIVDENDAEKDKAEKIREKEEAGKSTAGMRKARPKDVPELLVKLAKMGYSDASYYATSFLKAVEGSVQEISGLANAGFNDKSSLIDIFVIGQNVERKFLTKAQASGMLGSTAYKSTGWTGQAFNKAGLDNGVTFENSDIFAPMLALGKTPDGFFGANQGVGNDYYAQKDESSKAFGRLDTSASNFGYTDNFGEAERSHIKGNKSGAANLKYFKPFLNLNKNSVSYVSQMEKRLAESNIPMEMVVEDNPELDENLEPIPGGELTKYIGFDEYLKLIDENKVVGKMTNYSGEILNDYVQNELGYQGTWFDLVTDLRMEYIISIKNIASHIENFGSLNAFYLKDYVDFKKKLKECGLDQGIDDAYSEADPNFDEVEYVKNAFSSYGMVDPDEGNVDVFGEKHEVGAINSNNAAEKLEELSGKLSEEDYKAALRALQASGSLNGIDMIPMPDGSLVDKEDLDLGSSGDTVPYEAPEEVGSVGSANYNENYLVGNQVIGLKDIPKLDFSPGRSSESLENVVDYITSSVIETFGGLGRITSFKVNSGNILVNNCLFKLKGLTVEQAKALPYDLRYLLSSGNIAGLFDYSVLLKMKNLGTFGIDSDTLYDKVRVDWGKRNISAELVFKNLRSLRVLIIDGKKITKENMHEAGDVLHSAKVRNRMSGAQGSFTGNVFSKTWGWTKNVATNKELSLIQRAGGAAVGTALSGAALTAKGLFGLVRGGLKGAADAVSDAYTNR